MVEEKGLAPESADKIGGFVNGNAGGAKELWAKLTEENKFGDHPVSFIQSTNPPRTSVSRIVGFLLSMNHASSILGFPFIPVRSPRSYSDKSG